MKGNPKLAMGTSSCLEGPPSSPLVPQGYVNAGLQLHLVFRTDGKLCDLSKGSTPSPGRPSSPPKTPLPLW